MSKDRQLHSGHKQAPARDTADSIRSINEEDFTEQHQITNTEAAGHRYALLQVKCPEPFHEP